MVMEREDRGTTEGVANDLGKVLSELSVGDALESLRIQVDGLIDQLAGAEAESKASQQERQREELRKTAPAKAEKENAESGSGRGNPRSGGTGPARGLETEIESLGGKVESATDMLASLTDLLEAQTERLETLELQVGDPDFDHPLAQRATRDASQHELSDDGPETAVEPESGNRETRTPPSAVFPSVEALSSRRPQQSGSTRAVVAPDSSSAVAALADRLESLEQKIVRLSNSVASVRATVDGFHRESGDGGAVTYRGITGQRIEGRRIEGQEISGQGVRGHGIDPTGEVTGRPEEPPPLVEHFPEVDQRLIARLADRELAVMGGRIRQRSRSRRSVLVVDSSADARTVLSIYLSRTGYQVVTASSAEDCLSKLCYHEIDAVVMEPDMPGADGGHVCRIIRTDPAFKAHSQVPVIIYTSNPQKFDRRIAEQWQANDYVVKGGDMLPLVSALLRTCDAAVDQPDRD